MNTTTASTSDSTSFTTMPLSEVKKELRASRVKLKSLVKKAEKAERSRQKLEKQLLSEEFFHFAPLSLDENRELLRSSWELIGPRAPRVEKNVWSYHIGLVFLLRELINTKKKVAAKRQELITILADEAREHERFLALKAEIRRRE